MQYNKFVMIIVKNVTTDNVKQMMPTRPINAETWNRFCVKKYGQTWVNICIFIIFIGQGNYGNLLNFCGYYFEGTLVVSHILTIIRRSCISSRIWTRRYSLFLIFWLLLVTEVSPNFSQLSDCCKSVYKKTKFFNSFILVLISYLSLICEIQTNAKMAS